MEEREITTPPASSALIDAKTLRSTSCITFAFDTGGTGSPPNSGNGWLEVQEEWILWELQQGINHYNSCFRRLCAMGYSSGKLLPQPSASQRRTPPRSQANGDGRDKRDQAPAFQEYNVAELWAATKGFSADLIVSESGKKASNVVYKGRPSGGRLVAVKRFSKLLWPDPQQFVAEATGVGKVWHRRLVNLIGCCAEGDKRLLVAEYMPNDTLSKHLFHCMILAALAVLLIPICASIYFSWFSRFGSVAWNIYSINRF